MGTLIFTDHIEKHQEVVDCTGAHVGTVDRVEGEQIKLTRRGSADGLHHLIPAALVAAVDTKVHLTRSLNEVMQVWQAG